MIVLENATHALQRLLSDIEDNNSNNNDDDDDMLINQIKQTEHVIRSDLFAKLFASLAKYDHSRPSMTTLKTSHQEWDNYRLVKLERDATSNNYGFNCICIDNTYLFVNYVQPSSIASDAHIELHDQILALNGIYIVNFNKNDFLHLFSLLNNGFNFIQLLISKNKASSASSRLTQNHLQANKSTTDQMTLDDNMVLNTEWTQLEKVSLKNDPLTGSFGIGITGNRSTGVIVKTILPHSNQDTSCLRVGDHLLQVDDVNVRCMSSDQVAFVLRQHALSCNKATTDIYVARPVRSTGGHSTSQIKFQIQLSNNTTTDATTSLIETYKLADLKYTNLNRLFFDNDNTTAIDDYEYELTITRTTDLDDISFEYDKIEGLAFVSRIGSDSANSALMAHGDLNLYDQVVQVNGVHVNTQDQWESIDWSLIVVIKLKRSVQYATGKYVKKWKDRLGCENFEIIVNYLPKMDNPVESSYSLGITLEGTVNDVDNLTACCHVDNHHYIRTILDNGPIANQCANQLKPGDELLEVNNTTIYSQDYSTVLNILKNIANRDFALVCARRIEQTENNGFDSMGQHPKQRTLAQIRSSSLEFNGLTMWSQHVQFIELKKSKTGLGFSLIEYNDIKYKTYIVIRALVPNGCAQLDGRLRAGYRLISVNDTTFDYNCTLNKAIECLKAIPINKMVKLGVQRPLPYPNSTYDLSDDNHHDDQFKVSDDEHCYFVASSAPAILKHDSYDHYYPTTAMRPNSGSVGGHIRHQLMATDDKEDDDEHVPFLFDQTNNYENTLVVDNSEQFDLIELSVDLSSNNSLTNSISIDSAKCDDSEEQQQPTTTKSNRSTSGEGDVSNTSSTDLAVCSFMLASASINKTDNKQISNNIAVADTCCSYNDYDNDNDFNAISNECKLTNVFIKLNGIKNNNNDDNDDDLLFTFKSNTSLSSSLESFSRTIMKPFSSGSSSFDRNTYLASKGIIKYPKYLEKEIKIKKAYDDLGLTVDSNHDEGQNGCKIVRITENSAAHRDGRLVCGDYILAVNNENMRNITNATAKSVLKRASLVSTDIIIKYIPLTEASTFLIRLETGDTASLLRSPQHLSSSRTTSTSSLNVSNNQTIINNDRNESSTDVDHDDQAAMSLSLWGQAHIVTVYREHGKSIGISIVGGKVDANAKTAATNNNNNDNNNSNKKKNFISGIFIKHVLDNSPAGASGLLKTGDRILQVNGIDLTSSSHDNAVCVIRNARSPIHFLIQSLLGGPTTTTNNNIATTVPSTTADDQSHVDDVDYPFDVPNKFNYNLSDIRDKYSHLDGQVNIVQLKRKSQHESLGISLSGNLNLTKASVFICSICEESIAAKSGYLKVGDQIIEINGKILYGRVHSNVTPLIRSINDLDIFLVILRNKGNQDEMYTPVDSSGEPVMSEAHKRSVSLNDNQLSTIASGGIVYNREITLAKINNSFGMAISEDRNRRLIIRGMNPNGAACKNGNLNIGDQILSIDGLDVTGMQYDDVMQYLHKALQTVTFTVTTKPSSNRNVNFKSISTNDIQSKQTTISSSSYSASSSSSSSSSSSPRSHTQVTHPRTDPIQAGHVTVIEIERGKLGLGLAIVGGIDTHIPSILIHDIYENGAAAKDKRLRIGDQLLNCNDYDLKSLKHDEALTILRRQATDYIQLTVYRRSNTLIDENTIVDHENDDDKYDIITIDLFKRFGKGLGLSIVGRRNGNGVFVSHIIEDGCADKDGRLMVGDLLLEVNGLNIRTSPYNDVAYLLKTLPVQTKVQLKIGRFKALNLTTTTTTKNGLVETQNKR